MIPRGRPVVDGAGAAAVLGISAKTFLNKAINQDPAFPRPLNPGRRKFLYDQAQVEAYRDERPLPALPEGEDDSDLLDEHDAAELLGVAYATVRKDRSVGRMPEPVIVCGLVYYPRGELKRVPAEMRPGRGFGGGRPRKEQR